MNQIEEVMQSIVDFLLSLQSENSTFESKDKSIVTFANESSSLFLNINSYESEKEFFKSSSYWCWNLLCFFSWKSFHFEKISCKDGRNIFSSKMPVIHSLSKLRKKGTIRFSNCSTRFHSFQFGKSLFYWERKKSILKFENRGDHMFIDMIFHDVFWNSRRKGEFFNLILKSQEIIFPYSIDKYFCCFLSNFSFEYRENMMNHFRARSERKIFSYSSWKERSNLRKRWMIESESKNESTARNIWECLGKNLSAIFHSFFSLFSYSFSCYSRNNNQSLFTEKWWSKKFILKNAWTHLFKGKCYTRGFSIFFDKTISPFVHMLSNGFWEISREIDEGIIHEKLIRESIRFSQESRDLIESIFGLLESAWWIER